ncbi:glycosyltransferase family 2 protein [Patescibacteria group bacterium]|nr:glycosyltransferase family 2 protein [Patescibacteria group bacterium]
MKKVYIVIVYYSGLQNTLECLSSLSKIVMPKGISGEILVVENGAKEKISLHPADQRSKIKIIRNEENLGFAGGNNIGIKYALSHQADYVLLLNSDTLVREDFLKELLFVLEKDGGAGIACPKIYFAKGYEFHKYKKDELGRVIWYAGGRIDWQNVIASHIGVDEVDGGEFNKIKETEFATGCCMLIKKEAFEKVGLLDEKYFLYYEDSDLSLRLYKKGMKIMFVPKAVIWHKNAGEAGGAGSDLQDYYITRNRMLFGMRFAPFRAKMSLIRESIRLLLTGRPWQRRGILDFYLARFGKGSYKI